MSSARLDPLVVIMDQKVHGRPVPKLCDSPTDIANMRPALTPRQRGVYFIQAASEVAGDFVIEFAQRDRPGGNLPTEIGVIFYTQVSTSSSPHTLFALFWTCHGCVCVSVC